METSLVNPVNLIDPYGLWNFHVHEYWGGPGTVNGQQYRAARYNRRYPSAPARGWTEAGNFPRQGEPGFNFPQDLEDWSYYYHDTCLHDCDKGEYSTADLVERQSKCDKKIGR
jgi:hypothetical protein